MHRLIIHKLGPIEHCELECAAFMTFTGFQASGKSTAAKAVYYFRTVKEDIIELAKRQALGHTMVIEGLSDEFDLNVDVDLMTGLENYLRDKSLRTFGSSYDMAHDMYLEYYYTESCYIKISLFSHAQDVVPNFLKIEFSEALQVFLQEKDHSFSVTPLGMPEDELKILQAELYQIFDDSCMTVYIPAGRSMITLLSGQLSYIYANMDDMQRRSLDSCTRDYLERVLKVRPEFSNGLEGLAADALLKTQSKHESKEKASADRAYKTGSAQRAQAVPQALRLIKTILRGTYKYSNGVEQIILDNGKHVKISFSSSGQQECVWILNLLFYYLLQPKKMLFIIEEPEAQFFPASQKYMTELISMVSNCGHSIILTTHSPYVLGTLNNLLYAEAACISDLDKAEQIIPKLFWLDYKKFDSWFVKDGVIENCMDSEIHMIQNERIDEISKEINSDFDRLMNLQETDEENEVLQCR